MYLIINLYYRLFYFFFYGDEARFILPPSAWAYHGGAFRDEIIAGEFAFTRNTGLGWPNDGSRLFNKTITLYI